MLMNNKNSEYLKNPILLSSLVDYQENSIVSRTIIDKKTGTVTLFAFDKGQKLSEHTAPFDAMVFILDGNCEIKIGGNWYNVKMNEFIILPANIPHAVKATDKFKMLLVMIKSD